MARSLWTGSVSFGLVNIPVRMFPAVREHDVHFHQVAPDGSRIRYKRVSEKTGREVDYDKIQKAYEVSSRKVVTFSHDEIKDLQPASTKTIDIEDFVALDDIDPLYFERTYHLAPNGDAASKAYALLATVMEERQRVGIGSVVMREKQYLCAIRPFGKGLALSTMLFEDEIVPPADVDGVPQRRAKVTPKERQLAAQIIDSLESDWKPGKYHDTYQEQLRDIIRAKGRGATIEIEEPDAPAPVTDLMEALQASLARKGRAGSTAKRTATRSTKRTAKRTTKRTTKRAAPGATRRETRRKAS
jgi:DNA end-binding protein Ku